MRNNNAHSSTVLSQMLEPVSRSLGVKTARALTALRLAPRLQARVEKLAEKCNEGRLTAAERSVAVLHPGQYVDWNPSSQSPPSARPIQSGLMDAKLRQLVRQRAKNSCEYCRMSQDQEPLRFHIEHIIPIQHKGKDVPENLALACHHCNLHKGSQSFGD